MTDVSSETNPAAVTPPPAAPLAAAKRGAVSRAWNWVWRGAALKQLRQRTLAQSALGLEQARRARLLLELAERAQNPAEPLPSPATAVALELYRQAAYWAVQSEASLRAGAADASAAAGAAAGSPEQDPAAQKLSALVEQTDFIRCWDLSKEACAVQAGELALSTRAVLGELDGARRQRDALWLQRLFRLGLLLIPVVATIAGVRYFSDRDEQARDVALGKSWLASSSVGMGCHSPEQSCAESPDFFFHTNEEQSPWLELDLGKSTSFTAVRVDNRRDCCFDRAIPLIVEVSSDHTKFREVARRTTAFSSWLVTFEPTQARYVRLRIPTRGPFHLGRVRVLR